MEIERKFLLKTNDWQEQANEQTRDIRQVYLLNVPECTVRVGASTLFNEEGKHPKGYLTIKLPRVGRVRDETEFELDPILAQEILAYSIKSGMPHIRKTRHYVPRGELLWEIDEFQGRDLVMAEVELPQENYPVVLPPWVGQEVTNDPKFYNVFLAETATPNIYHIDPEVQENFIKNWSFLLDTNGEINQEKLKLELADFSFLIKQIPSVYCHVTGGMLSKHMYEAATINGLADDYYWKFHRDMILDDIEGMETVQEVRDYLKS